MSTTYFDANVSAYRGMTKYIIWFVGCAFGIFQFFLQLSSGVMVNELITTFHITAYGAGLLVAAYYYVYFILQTPAGILMDRFGARHLLTYGCLACSLGSFAFAWAPSPMLAALARVAMGAGGSFAFVGSIHVIHDWFEPKKFHFMVGLTEMMGMLVTAAGTVFLADFLVRLGWRESTVIIACVGLVIAAFSWVFIRDNPEHTIYTGEIRSKYTFWQRVNFVIREPALWLNGLYSGLAFTTVTVFSALWAIPFLLKDTHQTLSVTTLETTMVYIGIAISSPFFTYWSGRKGVYRPYLISGAAISTVLFMLILALPNPPQWLLFFILFCLGVSTSTYVLTFPLATQLAPPQAKSTSVGFTNALCVIAAPIFQPVVGYLLNLFARQHSMSATLQYSLQDYKQALWLMPILLAIATIVAYLIPEPTPVPEPITN